MSNSVHERIADARQRLRAAGIPAAEAGLDARLLAQHVLGWDAAALLASGQEPAPAAFGASYDALVTRRATREPLAYITGTKEFWGLALEVSPAVLIPRPETEWLVEAALAQCPIGRSATIADVCTGSGCIAVALATERPQLQIVATDLSERALSVAARNAHRHGVTDRIRFVRADMLSGITARFDAIVSNPPYVPAVDRLTLQPEVGGFEPALALFGGADGLDIVRALIEHATVRLSPGGVLLFEFGAGQESAIRELIAMTAALRIIDVLQDLQGIPRVAVARLFRT
jgi:release factor glutamine methyltransferase